MKKTLDRPIPSLLAAALLLAGSAAARGADLPAVRYQAQPTNTSVTIQGTSTFHDWEMKGATIGGYLMFPADTAFDTNQAALPGLKDGLMPASGQATILVRSIHSQVEHLPDVMDGLMQDAMKQTNFAAIIYKVSELKLKQPRAAGQPFVFDAKGDLAIAGVTNKVDFPVTITPLDKTKIKVSGTAKLKMTDYKVTPPAPNILGLGLMKCGDEVTILFEWTLAPNAPRQP
jgi:polyisoprenoid-binding protein YceI